MSETPRSPIGRQFPSNTVTANIDTSSPNDCPAAVVSAVAEALDREVEELPPLPEGIDPDVVESIFGREPTPQVRERSVSFHYAGHDVIVESSGVVRIIPLPSLDGGF